jgi:hypothetical protein
MNKRLSDAFCKINDESIFHGEKINVELAEKWNELVLNSMHPNIFLTWEWLSVWVKWFGYNNRLKIIEIWDGLRLIGILPLYMGSIELFPKISVKGLKYIGDGDVVFPDFLGPIIRQGSLDSVLLCIEEVFESDKSDFRFIRLADMNLASEGTCCFVDALCKRFLCDIRQGDISPYIGFSGDYASFLGRFNAKKRSSIKRNEKKASGNFQLRLECYQSQDKVSEAFEIMVQVFQKANRGQNKIQGFLKEDYLGFHKDVARALARNGWLRIYVLYFNDIPVAYIYGYLFNNVFWDYQTSYDLTYKDYSPGAVILQMVIKSVIEEGVQVFEFLRGDEEYKFYFSTGHRQLSTAYVFKDKSYLYFLYRSGRYMSHLLSSAKKYLKQKSE